MTEDYVPPITKTCQMTNCKKPPTTRVKAEPPYSYDKMHRRMMWFWVCKQHGDDLVALGYEPMETLF